MNKSRAEKCLAWAQGYLSIHGYEIQDKPQTIRIVPRSTVTCLPTTKGRIYLKSMANAFFIDPTLLRFLSNHASTPVTQMIAENESLSCFLIEDAGKPLRNILKLNFKPESLCQALKTCEDIQISSICHVNELIMASINDWRLEKLPSLYQAFILKEDLLKAHGMTLFEIECLHQSTIKIRNLCEQLSEYKIPETLEHDDFHDNNILIKGGSDIISDWGDANISHSFFSCVSALNSARRHHHLQETDKQYQSILEAYLIQWQSYGIRDDLLEAFNLVKIIRHFVFALGVSRIKTCPVMESFPEYKGHIANSLRNFINKFLFMDMLI